MNGSLHPSYWPRNCELMEGICSLGCELGVRGSRLGVALGSTVFWPLGVDTRIRKLVSKELWQVMFIREQF